MGLEVDIVFTRQAVQLMKIKQYKIYYVYTIPGCDHYPISLLVTIYILLNYRRLDGLCIGIHCHLQ
jgi:hypothetical protein